jgi:O-antigen ligase
VTVSWRSLLKIVAFVGIAAVSVSGVVGVIMASPAAGWLQLQLAGFQTRVLGGLTSVAFQTDTSILYRASEARYLLDAFARSPLVGNGLGYAYQPPQGPAGTFWGDQAPYYAHDFYLWLLAKVGLVGATLFLCLVIVPLFRRIRTSSSLRLVFTSGSVALLSVSVVAPMPLGTNSSIAIGVVLGLAFASLTDQIHARRALPSGRAVRPRDREYRRRT